MTEIPLSSGRIAFVDDEDAERVLANGPWNDASTGYVRKTIYIGGGKAEPKYSYISMPHLILGLPNSTELDHIDRNKRNNQKANLRRVTRAQNAENVPRRTGRFRGAYYAADRGKWRAVVVHHGKHHHLGQYDTEDEAGAVAAEWRRVHMPYSEEAMAERPCFT